MRDVPLVEAGEDVDRVDLDDLLVLGEGVGRELYVGVLEGEPLLCDCACVVWAVELERCEDEVDDDGRREVFRGRLCALWSEELNGAGVHGRDEGRRWLAGYLAEQPVVGLWLGVDCGVEGDAQHVPLPALARERHIGLAVAGRCAKEGERGVYVVLGGGKVPVEEGACGVRVKGAQGA